MDQFPTMLESKNLITSKILFLRLFLVTGRLNLSPNCNKHCTSNGIVKEDKLINQSLLMELMQSMGENMLKEEGSILITELFGEGKNENSIGFKLTCGLLVTERSFCL